MLCFEAASCHCYTIREGGWASQRRKDAKREEKAQKKPHREVEKKGDKSAASLKGALRSTERKSYSEMEQHARGAEV